ncbi:class II fructose-bisphosphate aldolase [Mediterraneibacter sp. NSJ-55]|uniref:Class II fructose-bisphosphate aldolase n=1 Tax=Mediterraneibacter hominis TaxID=2763054 RepID=A0A923LIW7_9FIRM|nr:class II fructose-bisphosphate aldolase [Mediterraneibacter hominis]MBC5688932.1 class II fructose-bisphosphate aldolase [Mediterraneibacter hominis]
MLVNSYEMLRQADKSTYAVLSPDFFNQNSLKAYIEVAEEFHRPIIVAYSGNMKTNFLTLEDAAEIGRYYAKKAEVPVCLHIDHGYDLKFVKKAIDLGFTSVMIDGSSDPLETNVEKTQEIVHYAKEKNVCVEAEIGHVGSGKNYENEEENDSVYTEVKDCVEFINRTGIDSVAVSIGTAHGIYAKGTPKLNFKRLKELKAVVNIPLVLHGGSSSGDENLKRAAELGISKINLFTDIAMSGYRQLRESNAKNMMDMLDDGDRGMKTALRHYYHLLGK